MKYLAYNSLKIESILAGHLFLFALTFFFALTCLWLIDLYSHLVTIPILNIYIFSILFNNCTNNRRLNHVC